MNRPVLKSDKISKFYGYSNFPKVFKITDEILDTYMNRLEGSLDKMSEQDILEYVQEVVIGLNELNEQFDYFIETLEREELCEFIIKAANAAGLETEEDITEEWREW